VFAPRAGAVHLARARNASTPARWL
jgi:hypothetical protein